MKFIVSKTPQTYYHYGAKAGGRGGRGPEDGPGRGGRGGRRRRGATAVAAAAPADATGTPSALKVLQTITSDQDKQLLVDLNEVKVRGAVLTVVVTLRAIGRKPSQVVYVNDSKSGILSYDTGETAAMIKLDGFNNGSVSAGDPKTMRGTFKVPKGAKKVAITLAGLGTFDDVDLTQ